MLFWNKYMEANGLSKDDFYLAQDSGNSLNYPAIYKNFTPTTAVYPNIGNNVGYVALGLISEVGEILQDLQNNKFKVSEFGDAFYYMAQLEQEVPGYFFDSAVLFAVKDLSENGPLLLLGDAKEYLLDNMFVFADAAKKWNRDKNKEKIEVMSEAIKNIIISLLSIYYHEAEHLKKPSDILAEIFEENMKKLLYRKETNTLHGDGEVRS